MRSQKPIGGALFVFIGNFFGATVTAVDAVADAIIFSTVPLKSSLGRLMGGGRTLMAMCLDPRDGKSVSNLSARVVATEAAEEEAETEAEEEGGGHRALQELAGGFISTAT